MLLSYIFYFLFIHLSSSVLFFGSPFCIMCCMCIWLIYIIVIRHTFVLSWVFLLWFRCRSMERPRCTSFLAVDTCFRETFDLQDNVLMSVIFDMIGSMLWFARDCLLLEKSSHWWVRNHFVGFLSCAALLCIRVFHLRRYALCSPSWIVICSSANLVFFF